MNFVLGVNSLYVHLDLCSLILPTVSYSNRHFQEQEKIEQETGFTEIKRPFATYVIELASQICKRRPMTTTILVPTKNDKE
jgi:hypothetical protein